jgi:hypothetical protein
MSGNISQGRKTWSARQSDFVLQSPYDNIMPKMFSGNDHWNKRPFTIHHLQYISHVHNFPSYASYSPKTSDQVA